MQQINLIFFQKITDKLSQDTIFKQIATHIYKVIFQKANDTLTE